MEQKDCVFCRIAEGKLEVDRIEESKNFLAFPDKNPRTKGHTLIIPKKHFVNILDLPSALGSELIDIIKRVAEKKLREGATGFNLGMNNFPDAGQVVMHAHIHLIPRKKGDGFKVCL